MNAQQRRFALRDMLFFDGVFLTQNGNEALAALIFFVCNCREEEGDFMFELFHAALPKMGRGAGVKSISPPLAVEGNHVVASYNLDERLTCRNGCMATRG